MSTSKPRRSISPRRNGARRRPRAFFGKLVETFGASRIAFGSNFPATAGTLAEILGKAKASFAFLPPGDREWIFGKTAQTLYPALKD